MDENKVPIRYAKALLLSAMEKELLEKVKTDMALLDRLIRESPQLIVMLKSPVVTASTKDRFFEETFSGVVESLTLSFLHLLVSNNRESYLKEIVLDFFMLYKLEKGLQSAELTTAVELDDLQIAQFRELIESRFKPSIELTCKTDSTLIGGFVLRVEDQQIDASVSSKLKRLKKELMSTQS